MVPVVNHNGFSGCSAKSAAGSSGYTMVAVVIQQLVDQAEIMVQVVNQWV